MSGKDGRSCPSPRSHLSHHPILQPENKRIESPRSGNGASTHLNFVAVLLHVGPHRKSKSVGLQGPAQAVNGPRCIVRVNFLAFHLRGGSGRHGWEARSSWTKPTYAYPSGEMVAIWKALAMVKVRCFEHELLQRCSRALRQASTPNSHCRSHCTESPLVMAATSATGAAGPDSGISCDVVKQGLLSR